MIWPWNHAALSCCNGLWLAMAQAPLAPVLHSFSDMVRRRNVALRSRDHRAFFSTSFLFFMSRSTLQTSAGFCPNRPAWNGALVETGRHLRTPGE